MLHSPCLCTEVLWSLVVGRVVDKIVRSWNFKQNFREIVFALRKHRFLYMAWLTI